jgi:D-beta-D-heptose 7-phosphate kinase/D-beta-D-heptose 1-phosphate adenosyltransferase
MRSNIYTHPSEILAMPRFRTCVATSGGFDPMHVGHLRCIQQSAEIAAAHNSQLVVIVNGDGFLKRKKGFAFMPETERAEIIAGVRGVDAVVLWDDGSQYVTGALDILRPLFFTKGGDRASAANVPEFDLCEQIGCKVVFGVGGGKIQSSSDLVKAMQVHR